MAVAIAVDMDAGSMAAEKMAARKPNPATNGLGSDGVDGLQNKFYIGPRLVAIFRKRSIFAPCTLSPRGRLSSTPKLGGEY